MIKRHHWYALIFFAIFFVLTGISIGITLVSNKRKRKNWSSKGVVIRFDN